VRTSHRVLIPSPFNPPPPLRIKRSVQKHWKQHKRKTANPAQHRWPSWVADSRTAVHLLQNSLPLDQICSTRRMGQLFDRGSVMLHRVLYITYHLNHYVTRKRLLIKVGFNNFSELLISSVKADGAALFSPTNIFIQNSRKHHIRQDKTGYMFRLVTPTTDSY